MLKVFMMPTPSEAAQDDSNSINAITLALQKHLPAYGVEITENRDEADLVAAHAGQTDGQTVCDVAHVHGLMPTYDFPESDVDFAINAHVIRNIRQAKAVTVPSQWVADILRRDMHLAPDVIGWAIDPDAWVGSAPKPKGVPHAGRYVLWNKTRVGGVCDPTPLNELVRRLPDQSFVTTFGDSASNVEIIGRQPFNLMKPIVQNAGVYLATTRETWGISTVESMASGIPVLGYNWAGTADIVQHEHTGYLAKPGDIDGLVKGLAYCLEHRERLGANGRAVAQQYTWAKVAERFATIYHTVAKELNDRRLHVIDPALYMV